MDFINVIEALKTIKTYCNEKPDCKSCRLHRRDDTERCGVSPTAPYIPARWNFDLDPEESVPSIFK